MLLPGQLALQVLQQLHFIGEEVALVLAVYVHLGDEFLKVIATRFRRFYEDDVSFAHVYDLLIQCINHNLKIAVHGLFGEAEKQTLRYVVFPVEVRRAARREYVLKIHWIGLRELVARQWLVVAALRRVDELLYEHWLLWLVITHPPEKLVLIYEHQLGPRRVHLHLVHHHVGDA